MPVDINWGLLGPPVDIGAHFQQGMKMGQEMVKKRRTENALRAYQTNPDDPSALNALAVDDPDMAFRLEQTRALRVKSQFDGAAARQKALADAEKQRQDNLIKGAQLVRAYQPKDQAGLDAVRARAQDMGLDVSRVPTVWGEGAQQFIQQLVAEANEFEPQKPEAAAPADVRSYQYRQSLPEAERAQFDRFQQNTRPQIFGSPEAGYSVFNPNETPPAVPQNVPTVTDAASYAALPPGAEFKDNQGHIRRKAGGQPAGAGNFPGRPAPL